MPESWDAGNFLELLENLFQKKILRRIGWCANYIMDKNSKHDAFLINFLFSNKLPNRCDKIQVVEEYKICTCFYCSIADLI